MKSRCGPGVLASSVQMSNDEPRLPFAEDAGSNPSRRNAEDVLHGRLEVHDPFELVRWLAFSQPDPRKALAELVQNSLDARAQRIRVIRLKEKGVPCLRIVDDGEGVIPELDRPEALRYIATHIGHSRKRSLSPRERLELMTQGQYGIGLLGFWSLGQTLELRSAVPGQRPHRLVLHRDSPEFTVEPIRRRNLFEDRWTEVVVSHLHKGASKVLIARRAAEYLASELRGQLVDRQVDLVVEDRIARGRADKIVPVQPRRILGERLEGIEAIEVEGSSPIRLELYLVPEEEGSVPPLALYSRGTLVAENFSELGGIGLDRPPWTEPRLTGIVDFPDLTVAPGSRRGVVPDEAAGILVRELGRLAPRVEEALRELEERRAEELDRRLIRKLQRAFRGFYRKQSRYALLPVQSGEPGSNGSGAAGDGEGEETGAPADGVVPSPPDEQPGLESEPAVLFPPGPLAAVELTPETVRIVRGTGRRVRARAVDAEGRAVKDKVFYRWALEGGVAAFRRDDGTGASVLVIAGQETGEGRITVVASAGDREARGTAPVEVVKRRPGIRSDEGIPEPELVEAPGASWRSRLQEERWQVNTAHPDYREIAHEHRLKIRYLAMLFAKEIVLRSSQDPRLESPLEELIEVTAFADRNLSGRRRKSRS